MDRNDHFTNSLYLQSRDDVPANEPHSNHGQALIATRLRTATNSRIDLDASIAWVERRIIRARMEYYTTPHGKGRN